MKWVERAALSRQICPSAAPRCCQGWLSIGEIKWRSTKASRGRGARMIDLGTQACNLDAVFGLLHQRPPDRRMVSAPARAPNIGAPHHRSQPHHRDRCRRYRPSATLSRSADSITAVQINPRKEKGWMPLMPGRLVRPDTAWALGRGRVGRETDSTPLRLWYQPTTR
jgi:hypothetical protein